MKKMLKIAAMAVLVVQVSGCASLKKTKTETVKGNAINEEAVIVDDDPQQENLSSAEFAQALDVVKSQNAGDAITRAETSVVCQRLYDNYRLMAGYAPDEVPISAPKSGSAFASILGGTLEVASGIAGIAGVAGGTDALLKSAQVSNAIDGTNTIVGLYGKMKSKMGAKEALAAPKKKTINVNGMAFSKGFQLNCPLAPMKAILDQ